MSYTYENLEIGATYKNYKELCEVLNGKIKTGEAKQYQLLEWERHFKYSKQGHKFIIDEIYDVAIEKVDNRKGGNNKVKYIDKIEKLILDLLVQEDNRGRVFLSKNRLLEELKMVNKNYRNGKYKPNKLSKQTKISRAIIDEFYSHSDSMLERNLNKALRLLEDKCLIIYETIMTVGIIDTHVPTNSFDKVLVNRVETEDVYGDIEVTFESPKINNFIEYRRATFEEKQDIGDIERKVLKELGLKSKSDIFARGLNKLFYNKVYEELLEKHNIHMYFKSYEITFNSEVIRDEIDNWDELEEQEKVRLNIEEKNETQKSLNDAIINQINNNVMNRHVKSKEKLNNIDVKNKQIHKIRSEDDYIKNNKTLTNILIKIEK